MFGGRYKGCLCESCEGCNRLDNDNFHGLFICDDFIRSPLVKDNPPKTYASKPYTPNTYSKKTIHKKEKKTYTIEINDFAEGKKFLSKLKSKQYFLDKFADNIEIGLQPDKQLVALFYCYDDKSNDYGSCYEVKTNDSEFKNELLNLYRGV